MVEKKHLSLMSEILIGMIGVSATDTVLDAISEAVSKFRV